MSIPSTERLLQRFLTYARIGSQADSRATTYPSSQGQWEVGRVLVDELRAMGLAGAHQDGKGLVHARIPGTKPGPGIALIAHVDTSPESPGSGVKPQVVRQYDGGDILLLGSGDRMGPAKYPELAHYRGKTLITSDGTTLLGADDKAGVAVIMEAAQRLLSDRGVAHGPVYLLFTCDEEIGHGVDHVDIPSLEVACAYTLDGGPAGELDQATFSADRADITIRGVNIHPSIGKGKMINAVRLAGLFLDRLPRQFLSPESTEGLEGFLHPYEIRGGVAETHMKLLMREFDSRLLDRQEQILKSIALGIEAEFPGSSVWIERVNQYRNLAEGLTREPRALALAEKAIRAQGIEPKLTSIRGGTDGSRLTERGLPTPNLFCGEHNPHSLHEWGCLEEMEQSVRTVLELIQLWGRESL